MRKSKEDALVGLSETHQSEEYEYELWGSVVGIAGRFLVVAPLNPAALWPVGTALYVRRVKESATEEPLNLDSFASSYPGEFKDD